MNRKYFAAAAAILAVAFAVIWFVYERSGTVSAFAIGDTAMPQINKVVYLTFDDGPSDRVTPEILDVLDEENVKATFFIIGRQAERRDYLIKREKDSGHTVAVHSYTHDYKEIYRSPESLIADMDKCNDVIESITGTRSDLYRFPGGSFGLSDKFTEAVSEHGMRYIDWNASTRDAELSGDAMQLYNSAIATSAGCNNVVLLSHDSTHKTNTAEATRMLIRYYRANGYTFRTL